MTNDKADDFKLLSIKLEDGSAEHMGSGMYVLRQFDEASGAIQQVAISEDDLGTLRTHEAHNVPVEMGLAQYAGDGLWRVAQCHEGNDNWQDVVISLGDIERLLAA